MTSHDTNLLQGMAVFGAVSEQALALILKASTKLRLSAGEFYLREGREAEAFYVLEQGRVRVQRSDGGIDIALAELGPGDCFGEMALIECSNRSASVVALEDCLALRVPLAALQVVMERDLEQFALIQMNLARELSRRLREADRRLFEMRMDDDTVADDSHWFVI